MALNAVEVQNLLQRMRFAMVHRGSRLIPTALAVAVAAMLVTALVTGCTQTTSETDAAPVQELEPAPPQPDEETPTETDADMPEGEQTAQTDDPAAEDETGEKPAGDADDSGTSAADQVAENSEDGEAMAEEDAGDVTEAKTMLKIKTNKGEIVAQLFDEKMPITAGSFLLLVEEDFYDGLTFHRVVPDFVIQGGDPNGDGSGGPGFSIPLENPGKVHHERGILSMARARALDSAGSQFFVCLSNNQNVTSLDKLGGGYAAFGKVAEGMDVADSIRVGDTITEVEILSESEHADEAREAAREARIK